MENNTLVVKGHRQYNKKTIPVIILEIFTALSMVSIFIPGLNPGRISGLINKNQSLFTIASSYKDLESNFIRALNKEWVTQSMLKTWYVGALIILLGIVVMMAGWCMTFGENKMRLHGTIIVGGGGLVLAIGDFVILNAYKMLNTTSRPDKIEPMLPSGIIVFFVISAIIIAISVLSALTLPKKYEGKAYEMQSKYKLFLMILPFVVLTILFAYLPLWGWRYAFFDYEPGQPLTMERFTGFKWFRILFENEATRKDVFNVLKNTLAMSGLGIATSWFAIAFAVFLTEIKGTRKRSIIQNFTTLPNFISWVLVYMVAFAMFSTDGFVNSLLRELGVSNASNNFLMDPDHMWLKMLAWGVWKGLGWSAIIYIAAIAGIDQELYEAATVDGAGRFRKIWHITVPGLVPTYCVLLLLSVANILSNGMDQYLVFKNAVNEESIKVLDLYVYLLGLGKGTGNIPLATVIGMVKSFVSVVLLFGANKISKIIRGESII
ncbi:MAG: ABC transporter permease subunit [Lachnospiraceae bacterium]|nr:ABC transporter permease subunit [Lachnospiraceae bacterium]